MPVGLSLFHPAVDFHSKLMAPLDKMRRRIELAEVKRLRPPLPLMTFCVPRALCHAVLTRPEMYPRHIDAAWIVTLTLPHPQIHLLDPGPVEPIENPIHHSFSPGAEKPGPIKFIIHTFGFFDDVRLVLGEKVL